MYTFRLLFAGLLTFCSAQSTTTLFLPYFDQQVFLASVAGSDGTATSYALACPPATHPATCNLPPSFTLTEGPATAAFTYSIDGLFGQLDCSLGGTTTAFCTVTATPVPAGSPSIVSTGLSGVELASVFQTVSLTDNLPVETGLAQTSDGEGLGGSTSGGLSLSEVTLLTGSVQSTTVAAQTSTPSGSNTPSTTGGSGTSSATAATKTSTAGISQITGNVGWAVVGGAALALAVAGL